MASIVDSIASLSSPLNLTDSATFTPESQSNHIKLLKFETIGSNPSWMASDLPRSAGGPDETRDFQIANSISRSVDFSEISEAINEEVKWYEWWMERSYTWRQSCQVYVRVSLSVVSCLIEVIERNQVANLDYNYSLRGHCSKYIDYF